MAADLLNAAQVLDPQTIRSNSKKEGTRKSYRNDIGTFALYCYNHDEPEYKSLLSNVLIEQWDNIMARNDITARRAVQVQKKKDKLMKEILKDYMKQDEVKELEERQSLIKVNDITTRHIRYWLCSVKKKVIISVENDEGEMVATECMDVCSAGRYSSLNTCITTYLFELYGRSYTEDEKKEMKIVIAGIKRTISARVQASGNLEQMEPGKREMLFELYRKLNTWLMMKGDKASVFARAFLVVTWNLMCRSESTTSVKIADLVVRGEDAIGIVFAHQKNDQDGSRQRKPRHIYANPIDYVTCPLLAIFEYLCLNGIRTSGVKLFKESSHQRFWNIVKGVLQEHEVELNQMGYKISDLGTHSMRKGAATYVSSGTTAAPNSISINLRGGWKMGINDVYMLYEKAGDAYVGRILSGLPVLSGEFASLPPYFECIRTVGESDEDFRQRKEVLDENVTTMKNNLFSSQGVPITLQRFLRMGLATAMFHFPQTTNLYPVSAAIRTVHYYRSRDTEALVHEARLKLPWDDGNSDQYLQKVTGVPPHVAQLSKLNEIKHITSQIVPQLRQELNNQTEQIRNDMDDRHMGGVFSEARMRTILSETSEGYADAIRDLNRKITDLQGGGGTQNRDNSIEIGGVGGSANEETYRTYLHSDGKRRKIPEGWKFPDCSLDLAFELWVHGSPLEGYPPYRVLTHADVDFVDRRATRTLNDLAMLCNIITDTAKARNIFKEDTSPSETRNMLNACKDGLEIPAVTNGGNPRDINGLKWTSAAVLHRAGVKRKRESNGDMGDYRYSQRRRIAMGGIRRNATTNTNMMNGRGTGRGRGERGRRTIRIEGDHGRGAGPGRAIRIGGHGRGFRGGRNARGQGRGGRGTFISEYV